MRKIFAGLMAIILLGAAFSYVSLSPADAAAVAAAEYGSESIRDLETASRLRELALQTLHLAGDEKRPLDVGQRVVSDDLTS